MISFYFILLLLLLSFIEFDYCCCLFSFFSLPIYFLCCASRLSSERTHSVFPLLLCLFHEKTFSSSLLSSLSLCFSLFKYSLSFKYSSQQNFSSSFVRFDLSRQRKYPKTISFVNFHSPCR